MKVFLATAYPTQWSYISRFKDLASRDRVRVHSISDSPESADVVLFVDARAEHNDWQWKAIYRSDVYRKHRQKCLIYDETDQPWCSLPGLYVSMPRASFCPEIQRAVGYAFGSANTEALVTNQHEDSSPDLLFSFMGRRCHPTRDAILAIKYPRALMTDTTAFNFFGAPSHCVPEMEAARSNYIRSILHSKFVLCPRGSGTASFRLFETLAAGRVPVIISDDWVPIEGPEWRSCSIHVAERDINRLGSLLEEAEPTWRERASAARQIWNDYFAIDVIWHRMMENCAELVQFSPKRSRPRYFDARYARIWARHVRSRLSKFCSKS